MGLELVSGRCSSGPSVLRLGLGDARASSTSCWRRSPASSRPAARLLRVDRLGARHARHDARALRAGRGALRRGRGDRGATRRAAAARSHHAGWARALVAAAGPRISSARSRCSSRPRARPCAWAERSSLVKSPSAAPPLGRAQRARLPRATHPVDARASKGAFGHEVESRCRGARHDSRAPPARAPLSARGCRGVRAGGYAGLSDTCGCVIWDGVAASAGACAGPLHRAIDHDRRPDGRRNEHRIRETGRESADQLLLRVPHGQRTAERKRESRNRTGGDADSRRTGVALLTGVQGVRAGVPAGHARGAQRPTCQRRGHDQSLPRCRCRVQGKSSPTKLDDGRGS